MSETSTPMPHKQIGVAVIRNKQGKILIDRRLNKGDMGGLWEFPGGKIEPQETVKDCIRREVKEELDIEIEVGDRLLTLAHTYANFKVTLFVHNCEYVSGEPQLIESQEVRWVNAAQMERYEFPQANSQIISILQERGTAR